MILHDFYTVENYHHEDTALHGEIRFNAEHLIFKGHFPATPVVPGVCMMQIVQEIIEKHTGAPKRISDVQQMKFLTLINPAVTPSVRFSLSYSVNDAGLISVNGSLLNEAVVYFRFKGNFVADNTKTKD